MDLQRESILRRLAKFVLSISYENVPEEVTHRAKNLLLDAIGAIIHGRDMPAARIAWELIKSSKGDVTVIGHDLKVAPGDAVFANSAFAAGTALDDFLFTFHPGQVNVPTAIAVSEQEKSSGADLISALVAGYDVMGRIHLGGPNIAPRFRGLGSLGPFGAAAAAGKLMKLNEDQFTHALGYAANFSSGLTQCWIAGTMEGNFHGGIAAKNGIAAVNLAKAGAVAAENTLEGERGFYNAFAGTTEEASQVLVDLNKRFLIMEASYKPYPVCALQQVPIDLISNLVKENRIQPEDVKEVIERVSEWEAAFPGSDFAGPFENPDQPLLSSQFCAAAAFLGKPVRSCSFYRDHYHDPEIFALAQKVKLIGEKERKVPEITVTLHSGKTFRVEEEEGTGILTPTDENVKTKFNELTSELVGKKRAGKIIDLVMSLEKLGTVGDLTHQLGGFRKSHG
jgi:2-methylcitrate dehydratase PrpD